eukprot:TRINITY_DN3116_c0_g1_i1.p1 TRINITY_DN3116_c0_g1~~TRINITY_DN3116_c0_g1_i1.p1  ORF type:complete len:177 (-),score=45.57 TRINITY_DN3116_c0_g1_i1:206-736(-)
MSSPTNQVLYSHYTKGWGAKKCHGLVLLWSRVSPFFILFNYFNQLRDKKGKGSEVRFHVLVGEESYLVLEGYDAEVWWNEGVMVWDGAGGCWREEEGVRVIRELMGYGSWEEVVDEGMVLLLGHKVPGWEVMSNTKFSRGIEFGDETGTKKDGLEIQEIKRNLERLTGYKVDQHLL